MSETIALSRYLAQCGVCARRKSVEIIRDGLITINGELVTEPWYRVQPDDVVMYQGKRVESERKISILLNKPRDYITTLSDPQGRKTILDLLKNEISERIFPVGRLDRTTTGLILLTNDGDLSQHLAHPKYKIKKMYDVQLDRPLTKQDLKNIIDGFDLNDGFIKVDDAQILSKESVRVQLHSGRNRIVRRIFKHFGYEVEKLDRVGLAHLTKKGLSIGTWRYLTDAEIKQLMESVEG